MSNFERRLQALHRRPEATPGGSTTTVPGAGSTATAVAPSPPVLEGPADGLGWLAAERLAHLVDVPAGASMVLAVDLGDDHAMLEVVWGADGVAQIRVL